MHFESLRLYCKGVPALEQHGHESEWGKLADLTNDLESGFSLENRGLKKALLDICEANEKLFVLAKKNEAILPFRLPSPDPYEEPTAALRMLEERIDVLLEAQAVKYQSLKLTK